MTTVGRFPSVRGSTRLRAVNRLPIRVRLTLIFAAIMAIGLTAAGVLIYLRFESGLNGQIDDALQTRADVLAAQLRRTPVSGWNAVLRGDTGFSQVVAPFGSIAAATPQVRGRPLVEGARLDRAQRGPLFFEIGRLPHVDSQSSRLIARPIRGRSSAVIIAGEPLRGREDANESLAAAILIGGPLILLFACAAGYVLAAAAFRPVESMRQRAAEFSAEQPADRLPLPASRDELYRLGVTLNQMLDRVEIALRRERAFVADASHELRTPLAVLTSEIELALMRERSAGELRRALQAAGGQTERLRRLAEDLLTIARSDQEGLEVERHPVVLADVLEPAARRIAVLAEERGRRVRVDPSPELVVEVDDVRLEQALINLLDNALTHGSGDITVRASSTPEGIEVVVHDEGTGPPADFRGRAFERFSRAPEAGARPGAGLGLAIVDAVATAHGGTVIARDAPGGGFDAGLALPFPSDVLACPPGR